MVGRYESAELKREASAHELLHARRGMMARLSCLVGLMCVAFGFAAPLFSASLEGLFSASSPMPSPSPLPVQQQPSIMTVTDFGNNYVPLNYGSAPYSIYGSGGYGGSSGYYAGYGSAAAPWVSDGVTYMGQGSDRWRGFGIDSTLLALFISVVALCLWPQIRGQKPPGGTAPWAAAVSGGRPDGRQALYGMPDFGPGGPRTVVDVRPGELTGSLCGGATGLFGAQAPVGGAWPPAPTPTTTNSWNTPVPRPGFAPPGTPGAPGTAPVPGVQGIGGLVNAAGAWLSGLGGSRRGAGLPTDAEVQETYQTFSVELPQWSAGLSTLIEHQLLGPLLKQLEESDQEWTKAMQTLGYRLSMDAPRVFGWPHGVGAEGKELSVHETNLPEELAGQPGATHKWQRRQLLETCLKHPSFEPAQRQHVLERLCQWRHVGLARSLQGLRCGLESSNQGEGALPTDAHILENLVVKMLQQTPGLDFASRFWTSAGSNGPPGGSRGYDGQPLVAWLRQVTDQESTWPRPAPHYEVVTPTKTWKLRPSPLNILEALALLLHELRKCPRSYQLFNDDLRKVVERVDDYRNHASGGLATRGFAMF